MNRMRQSAVLMGSTPVMAWAAAVLCIAAVPVQAQNFVNSVGAVASASDKTGADTLVLDVTSAANAMDQIAVLIVTDPVGNATAARPVVTDNHGHTYVYVRNVSNRNNADTNGVRTYVFLGLAADGLVVGDTVTVAFPAALVPAAKGAMAVPFTGVLRQPTGVIDRADTATADNSTTTGALSVSNIRRQWELVLAVWGVEAESAVGLTPGGDFSTLAPGTVGTTGGAANSNVSLRYAFLEASTLPVSGYSATGTLSAAANSNGLLLTFRAGPGQGMLTPPVAPITAGACGAATAVNLQLRNTLPTPVGTPIPPSTNTTLQVTSNSPGARFFTNVNCGGNGSAALNLTFNNNTSNQVFYIRDTTKNLAGWTLTATRTAGNLNIAAAVATYTVSAGAATAVLVRLPGQSFVDGVGPSGTPTDRVVNVPFAISGLYAVDAYNNVDDAFAGTRAITWVYSGPATGNSFTTPVTFASGISTTPLITVLGAQASLVTLTASTPGVVGLTSSPFNVTAFVDTTTITAANSPGYANRADGSGTFKITNGTGGFLTQVVFNRPTGWPNLLNRRRQTAPAGFTASAGSNNSLTFTATGQGLPSGGVITFTVQTGSTYPNVTIDTIYPFNVTYISQTVTGARQVDFEVRVPIAPVLLPAISRNAVSGSRPMFYFTAPNLDANGNATRTSSGVLVVRGTLTTDAVACDPVGGTTSCTESAALPLQTGVTTYTMFNRDTVGVYSTGTTLTVNAQPTQAGSFIFKMPAFTLAEPAIKRGNASLMGYGIIGATNNGLYFVKADGSEQRRALPLAATLLRRASQLPMSSSAGGGTRTYLIDSGASASIYQIDPSAAPAPAPDGLVALDNVGMPVTAGVGHGREDSFAAFHANYEDLIFVATSRNDTVPNEIRAYQPDLTTPLYWTRFLPPSDRVLREPYVDHGRGLVIFPITTRTNTSGEGGILALDLTTDPGIVPSAPPGWPTKVLGVTSGTRRRFQAQCRAGRSSLESTGTSVYFCGSAVEPSGNPQLYAISPVDGSVMASVAMPTSNAAIQTIIPLPEGGGVILTGASGLVARALWNGTTLSLTWAQQTNGTSVSTFAGSGANVGGPTMLGSGPYAPFVYIGANGRMVKLERATGAYVSNQVLDGVDVSDLSLEAYSGTIYAGTDAGSFWGIPLF